MVRLGLEPGAATWKAQTNPLSYGGIPSCGLGFKGETFLLKIRTHTRLGQQIFQLSLDPSRISGLLLFDLTSHFPVWTHRLQLKSPHT